jgi:hypothetical protein
MTGFFDRLSKKPVEQSAPLLLAHKADNPFHLNRHALPTTQTLQPEHRQAFSSNISKPCLIALSAPDNG